MASVLLPAAFAICASLGISKSSCDDGWKIMAAGSHQTDTSKWYSGNASSPDSFGKPSESHCRNATPIATYDIFDGSKGTTYACLEPLADDHITDLELDQIGKLAARLNSISPKTLDDHRRAMQLKWLVKSLAGDYN